MRLTLITLNVFSQTVREQITNTQHYTANLLLLYLKFGRHVIGTLTAITFVDMDFAV